MLSQYRQNMTLNVCICWMGSDYYCFFYSQQIIDQLSKMLLEVALKHSFASNYQNLFSLNEILQNIFCFYVFNVLA